MRTISMIRHAAWALSGTTIFCGAAWAAGFALQEQNSSGLGNAYAGTAALAEDASTIFSNAAGMTQLSRPSLVISAAAVDVNSKFHNDASVAALGQTLGSEGGNAGGTTFLPALYFAMPVSNNVSAGVGINAPFGLKTEYDADWMGRFQALKSEVVTTNFNTALAFKFGGKLSLGLGVDYQTITAELTKGVNYTAVIAQGAQSPLLGLSPLQIQGITTAAAGLQGTSKVKGDDAAWGWDAGLLFTPTDNTHVGVSYRSAMKYHVVGDATITAPTSGVSTINAIIAGARAGALADGPVTLDIELPASAHLGITQKIGSALQLMAEASWAQWSHIAELKIVRTSGAVLSNTVEKWEDTWRFALGGNCTLNNAWKLRAGVAMDQSPVPDTTRTPRLPDNDRMWYAVGAQWQVTPTWTLDAGYSYLTVKNASLNQNDGSTNAYGLLAGEQHSSINILGLQATVSF